MDRSSDWLKPIHPLQTGSFKKYIPKKLSLLVICGDRSPFPGKYFYSNVKTLSSTPDTPGGKGRFRAGDNLEN